MILACMITVAVYGIVGAFCAIKWDRELAGGYMFYELLLLAAFWPLYVFQ